MFVYSLHYVVLLHFLSSYSVLEGFWHVILKCSYQNFGLAMSSTNTLVINSGFKTANTEPCITNNPELVAPICHLHNVRPIYITSFPFFSAIFYDVSPATLRMSLRVHTAYCACLFVCMLHIAHVFSCAHCIYSEKGKTVPLFNYTMKEYEALVGGEWSTSCHGRFAPGERALGAHWIGSWVNPQSRSGRRGEEKILHPTGTRTPTRSQSLYRLC
jgi:hypothetical protein